MVGCAVAACHNHHRTTRSKGITYHSFPRDPKLAKIWVIKSRRKDTLNIGHGRVCSDHFLPTDYEDDMKNRLLGLKERKILKRGAVPSLKLSSCDDGDERTSSRTERIRKRNILQRALRRLKSLSPKRIDDSSKLECSSKVNHQLHVC
ncbi:hypothetical protein AVEN_55780-1 [Araneus ventricosus]|uniref:THAP-type domain-containing protein n=1 Tax=Araneus ventricosus TaxID=182803 RepID=A0A4Y2F042_ARAVE|nr:hypothetical protein AVEN_55780-1 [Araneus ventricosus]